MAEEAEPVDALSAVPIAPVTAIPAGPGPAEAVPSDPWPGAELVTAGHEAPLYADPFGGPPSMTPPAGPAIVYPPIDATPYVEPFSAHSLATPLPPPMPMPQSTAMGPPSGAFPAGPAPGGFDPRTGRNLSDRSRTTAGLLQLFVGWVGAGRFYTGHTGLAIAQLATVWTIGLTACCLGGALTAATGGLAAPVLLVAPLGLVWPVLDGIRLLARGGTDSSGAALL